MGAWQTHDRPPRNKVTRALQKRWQDCGCKACGRWLAWLDDANAIRPDSGAELVEGKYPRVPFVQLANVTFIRCPYCGDEHAHGAGGGPRDPHCAPNWRRPWTKGHPQADYILGQLVQVLPPPVADPPEDLEPVVRFKVPRHIKRVTWEGKGLFGLTKTTKRRSGALCQHSEERWAKRDHCLDDRDVVATDLQPTPPNPDDPQLCPICKARFAVESLEFLARGGRHPGSLR